MKAKEEQTSAAAMMGDDEAGQLLWEHAESGDGDVPMGAMEAILANPEILRTHLRKLHGKGKKNEKERSRSAVRRTVDKGRSPDADRRPYHHAETPNAPTAGNASSSEQPQLPPARVSFALGEEQQSDGKNSRSMEKRFEDLKDRVYTVEQSVRSHSKVLQKLDAQAIPAVSMSKRKESTMRDFYKELLALEQTMKARSSDMIAHFHYKGAYALMEAKFQSDQQSLYNTAVSACGPKSHIQIYRGTGVIRKESETLIRATFAVLKTLVPTYDKSQWNTQ